VLEYLPDTLVCLCGALKVLLGANLLTDILGLMSMLAEPLVGGPADTDLLWGHRLLGGLVQLLNRLLVEAQILLAANQDDGQALAEVQNLGDPLCRS
jgi:hypothetical protein